MCCISFDSYIKPQRHDACCPHLPVVYLLIPTSNHNFWFTFTILIKLYIFWFLHQTTTACESVVKLISCISFDSYIKPQPSLPRGLAKAVVYLLIPTSNHNVNLAVFFCGSVVYLLIPTSNHNSTEDRSNAEELYIFWFLHQTTTKSNAIIPFVLLYIFWFLHQTTTSKRFYQSAKRCISFDSYIKPQPCEGRWVCKTVVYLLIPTSNHNSSLTV